MFDKKILFYLFFSFAAAIKENASFLWLLLNCRNWLSPQSVEKILFLLNEKSERREIKSIQLLNYNKPLFNLQMRKEKFFFSNSQGKVIKQEKTFSWNYFLFIVQVKKMSRKLVLFFSLLFLLYRSNHSFLVSVVLLLFNGKEWQKKSEKVVQEFLWKDRKVFSMMWHVTRHRYWYIMYH